MEEVKDTTVEAAEEKIRERGVRAGT